VRHFSAGDFHFATFAFIEFVKCWGSGGRSRLFAFVNFSTFIRNPGMTSNTKWIERRVRKPKFKAILMVAKIQHLKDIQKKRKSRTNPRGRLSVQPIFRKGIKWKQSSWLEQPQEFIFSGDDIIT
jgi:hypothetical protein